MFGKILAGFAAVFLLAASASAEAQAVRSTQTATNGVAVTVYRDDFAGRGEFSAPSVDFQDGFILVAQIKKNGAMGKVFLTGSMIYSGEWRYYDGAIFRGGEEAVFTSTERKVVGCSGSRYGGGCTLSESFNINVTPDQIKKYAVDGILAIQIRATRTSSSVIVQVPVSYFDAVAEVARQP